VPIAARESMASVFDLLNTNATARPPSLCSPNQLSGFRQVTAPLTSDQAPDWGSRSRGDAGYAYAIAST